VKTRKDDYSSTETHYNKAELNMCLADSVSQNVDKRAGTNYYVITAISAIKKPRKLKLNQESKNN
jgi:hypothetical protein